MNCLVTGSTGFIGSALTKRLVKEGYNVKALIHNKKSDLNEKNVEYILCDLTKPSDLKKLPLNIDVLYHCAALVRDYGPKNDFYSVNFEGTKNLVDTFKNSNLNYFIFLSHINYEEEKEIGYYNLSKRLAESYLNEKFEKDNFPTVIIRPGNVYGPGANTWVIRIIELIKKKRIALIDNGKGIFLHTYIDNLIDALIATMNTPKSIGQTIDITDGDYSVTWGKYFNDLVNILGEKPIKKNFSKKSAMILAKIMMFMYKLNITEPWVTPTAVGILTNNKTISIKKAEKILKYQPKIDYHAGMKNVENWLRKEGYIN